jgi:DNA-binding NarL/FixJ family response regulator
MIIADDHPIVRAGIVSVFEDQEKYRIIGQASNGQELIYLLRSDCPDVVLMDVKMPGMKVKSLISFVHLNCPDTKVIVLSAYDDPGIIKTVIDENVDAYLLKDEMQDVLVKAIDAVMEGNSVWMSDRVSEIYRSTSTHTPTGSLLSEREWNVVDLLKRGYSNKEIALELDISKSTVSFHVSNILSKLNLTSRVEIVVWANNRGR